MNKIALIGFGAVGASFGADLCKAYSDNFAVIADAGHTNRIKNGVWVNGELVHPVIINGTEKTPFVPDLLIVCVKNYNLADAIGQIAAISNPQTVILSILNGISAPDVLRKAFPENDILRGFARIMAVRNADSSVTSSAGRIFFGRDDNNTEHQSVKLAKQIFDKAGIAAVVPDDIMREVWNKFMINIGTNQVSAVTGADYSQLKNIPEQYALMREAMNETVRVAQAYDIALSKTDVDAYCSTLTGTQKGKSSTLQDVENRRKTEIDYFSGTLIQYAAAKHIDIPVNKVLYALIKSIEAMYLK